MYRDISVVLDGLAPSDLDMTQDNFDKLINNVQEYIIDEILNKMITRPITGEIISIHYCYNLAMTDNYPDTEALDLELNLKITQIIHEMLHNQSDYYLYII